MIKRFRSWNEYRIDQEKRKTLQRELTKLSILARTPGPQQAVARQKMNNIRLALKQTADTKKDTLVFKPMEATYFYSNSPNNTSSTWITDVRYKNNNIKLNRKYDCPANPAVLRLMLNSKSLGRYFNKHFRLK